MKTIKIMSDGNQAKVGMIIYDAYTKSIGVITYIKDQNLKLKTKRNGIWSAHVWNEIIFYKPIVNPVNCNLTNETGFDCTLLSDASKATPEQKKLYWLELEKQNIQFRPEFEAKLKELGIRDQFVNNLFDPKWLYSDPKEKRQQCLNSEIWYDFINDAFVWDYSPEGWNYWEEIAIQ